MPQEAHSAHQRGEPAAPQGTTGADRRHQRLAAAQEAAGEAVLQSTEGTPVQPEPQADQGVRVQGDRSEL